MGYIKEIGKVYIDGDNYSAEGTISEMKKMGVTKDVAECIENKVKKVELINFYETSGAVEYGMAVELQCTFDTGHTVYKTINGMTYLSWVQEYGVNNRIITGEFIFLFQGVISDLVVYGSEKHKRFLIAYEEQEEKENRIKDFTYKIGDIVNIYGRSVYLGEYYYQKPNLKNNSLVNKLRKYKLYLELKDSKPYEEGRLRVESGKTKDNQPTEILGYMAVDMKFLKEKANERMESMFTSGVGYYKGNYSTVSYDKENNKAYVLHHVSETKEDLPYMSMDTILKYGWLCGFENKNAGIKREKVNSRSGTYYVYKFSD